MAGRLIAGLGVVSAALLLAACGGGSTTLTVGSGTTRVSSGGKTSTSITSMQGPSGSVSESFGNGGVSLPSGFPGSVPLPAHGTLVLATRANAPAGGTTSSGAGGSTGATYDLIYSYPTPSAARAALRSYDGALASAGYSETLSSSSAGSVLQAWTSSAWRLSVVYAPTGSSQRTEIDVTVAPPTSAG
jgi:hypothetical protein